MIEQEKHGMICTLSKRFWGWPFGSVASYALTESGEPILLISEIAEHTHNLRADARVSLFVEESTAREDPQAGPPA